MQQLIFIGTLHLGFTPLTELKELLLTHKPNMLLVEIQQQDLNTDNISTYPEEMQFCVNYAKEHAINCKGFDCSINIEYKKVQKEDQERLLQEQTKIIQQHNWKTFNKEEYGDILKTLSWNKVININKWNEREEHMNKNIQEIIKQQNGTIVIVTGSGHIPYFRKQFPKARFIS